MADKTYGVKMPEEKKNFYQALPRQYGMESEQFLDAMYQAFLREQKRQELSRDNEDYAIIVALLDRIEVQCSSILNNKAEWKKKLEADTALIQQQLHKAWADHSKEKDTWIGEMQAVKEHTDIVVADAIAAKEKADALRREYEVAREKAEEDRRQSQQVLAHQEVIIQKQCDDIASLKAELESERNNSKTLSKAATECSELKKQLEEAKAGSELAIEKAVMKVEREYLDRLKNTIITNSNHSTPPDIKDDESRS